MKTILQHLPPGHPNRPGTKLWSLKAIVIHYTANDKPGATDEANVSYISRPFKRTIKGDFEADGVTKFRYASAHIWADMDSVTEAIPTDEVTWNCGDRPLPYDSLNKGQRPFARTFFGNRQNFQTISIEICNNDVLPGPRDWQMAVGNAADWIVDFCNTRELLFDLQASLNPGSMAPEKGKLVILTHNSITGKLCPKPFLDDPQSWVEFIEGMYNRLRGPHRNPSVYVVNHKI